MSTTTQRRTSRARRVATFSLVALGFMFTGSIADAGGGYAISVNPVAPTTETGASFDVTTGGGNRNFTSVRVSCSDAQGVEVYATVLTVEVPPKGTGTSQTIYPPASECTANLEKLMQIGKSRVLATATFTVITP